MENNNIPSKISKAGVASVILCFLILASVYAISSHQNCIANPVTGSNPCAPKDATAATSDMGTSTQNVVNSRDGSSVSINPEPLSQAIEHYSESSASNVDVLGTITNIVPQETGLMSPYGNTIIINDGAYKAAVHQINPTDFQNLIVGDWVEVRGGYMQGQPGDTRVEIVHTGSVTVRLSAADNPH